MSNPWPKGTSGNPRGRPKRGGTLVEFMRYGAAQIVSDEDRRTVAQAIADTALKAAMTGDVNALKVVLDRLDGPITQRQEITGKDGGPLTFTIRLKDVADDDGE